MIFIIRETWIVSRIPNILSRTPPLFSRVTCWNYIYLLLNSTVEFNFLQKCFDKKQFLLNYDFHISTICLKGTFWSWAQNKLTQRKHQSYELISWVSWHFAKTLGYYGQVELKRNLWNSGAAYTHWARWTRRGWAPMGPRWARGGAHGPVELSGPTRGAEIHKKKSRALFPTVRGASHFLFGFFHCLKLKNRKNNVPRYFNLFISVD